MQLRPVDSLIKDTEWNETEKKRSIMYLYLVLTRLENLIEEDWRRAECTEVGRKKKCDETSERFVIVRKQIG